MLFEAQHGKYSGGGRTQSVSMDTSVAHMSVNTVDYVYSFMRGTRPLLCNNKRAELIFSSKAVYTRSDTQNTWRLQVQVRFF